MNGMAEEHEEPVPPRPEDAGDGAAGERSFSWADSRWTGEMLFALMEAARDRNIWDIPFGTSDTFWRAFLQEFDQDGRLPSLFEGS